VAASETSAVPPDVMQMGHTRIKRKTYIIGSLVRSSIHDTVCELK
jgi:hypothetical protein